MRQRKLNTAMHAAAGAAALVLLLLLSGGFSGAFGETRVSFSPVRIHLTPEGGTKEIVVRNGGSRPVVLQARLFEWRQEARGQDVFERTSEIVFNPPMMRVPAGGQQVIRLGARPGVILGGEERAYRLIVDEIQPPADFEDAPLRLRMRYSLPVFLTDREFAAELGIDLLPSDDAPCVIAARNEGSRHAVLRDGVIFPRGAAPDNGLDVDFPRRYLLPGSETATPCPPAAAELLDKGEIRLELETDAGPVRSAALHTGSIRD